MMSNFYQSRSWLMICSFLIFSFLSPVLSAQINELYGPQAKEMLSGSRYIMLGDSDEFPRVIKLEPGQEIDIRQLVAWLKTELDMPAAMNFELRESTIDDLGLEQYRYQQTYQGVVVDRGEYRVQARNGAVSMIMGNAFKIPSLPVSPALSAENARQKALDLFESAQFLWEIPYWEEEIKEHENDPNATYYPEAHLTITKFGNGNSEQSQYRLAYWFDVYALHVEKRVYIDATNGSVLYTLPLASNCEPGVNFTSIFNGIQSIRSEKYTANDYRLNDNCQSTEIWVRDWGSTTTTSSPTEIENTTNTWTTMDERFGATVGWETKQSYLYFLNVHSRSSYDDSNGDLKCYINAWFSSGGTLYNDNASMSFDGTRMKVGLGSSGTLANSWSSMDIIGHEFTHAVTGTSSGLVYQGESGALNESFSDIFGEMIELYSTGSNDWLMGDDRTDGAIRSMSNPKTFSDPDTYNGTNWRNTCGSCSDNGGVHTNSGVQNYWFFLVAQGGSGTNDNGDSYSVSGLGITAASAIAFRNQTVKLGNNSDYAAARAGAIAAAEDIYGSCSNAVKQVTNAWYAVGVGDPYVDVSIASSSNISCNGANDGSITLATVGTAPLSVVWDDGPTSTSRSNLAPGTYGATLTDGTGCTDYVSITLTQPPVLTASAVQTSNYNGYGVSCYGASDGSAQAIPSGGTPPYTYLWSVNAGSQMTAVATGLSAGLYGVQVTDANGCMANASVTITQPPLLTASISSASDYNGYNISCNGGSDGWATVSGSGGVPPYSYLWSDGQVTATASNLSAGPYTVTITDANGCESADSIVMTEPDPLTIEAGDNQTVYYGYPPAECADIAWSGAGGGVPPYNISWNDGGAQAHQVCPGLYTTTYYVTITDLNNCVAVDSVTICVIDVRCGNKLDKVEMCHVPEEDPLNVQTICVSVNSVAKHLAHGDMLAACGTVHDCDSIINKSEGILMSELGLSMDAYPNPFNSFTTIRFASEEKGTVTLSLYDNVGRLLDILYEGEVKAGQQYEQIIDGKALSSGVKICVLRHSNGKIEIVKLISQ